MLKNRADVKTLVFAVVISASWIVNWCLPEFHWAPFLLSCFGAICISSMVHNHVHVSTFKVGILNVIYDYWLSIVYGYPVFAWIATHNKNHHVYNNKAGDFAPSYVVSEKNNLFTLLSYPTVSGSIQQKVNFSYLKTLWVSNRGKCLYYLSQYVALIGFIVFALVVDWKKALLFVVIPQQLALNMVLVFNYIQHIHCDEESKFNHSRNILSPRMNFFLFNNGYHTAHHMKPLMHWSELKDQHSKIADKIDPRLNEPSLAWYFLRVYFLGPFVSSFRTFNMRLARIEREKAKGWIKPTQAASSPGISLN